MKFLFLRRGASQWSPEYSINRDGDTAWEIIEAPNKEMALVEALGYSSVEHFKEVIESNRQGSDEGFDASYIHDWLCVDKPFWNYEPKGDEYYHFSEAFLIELSDNTMMNLSTLCRDLKGEYFRIEKAEEADKAQQAELEKLKELKAKYPNA